MTAGRGPAAERARGRSGEPDADIVLHRPIPSRLLGPDALTITGTFAPMCTIGTVAGAVNGDDPVILPILWAVASVVAWVTAVRTWRMRTTLTAEGITVQGWWRRHHVRWDDLASIELGTVGRGFAGAVLHRQDGARLELTPGVQCLHRNRLRQARPLVAAARARGIPVWVDRNAKWSWRRSGVPVGPPADTP